MNVLAKHADSKPAEELAGFAAGLSLADVPDAVVARAKLQILDAIGVGLASNAYPFAGATLAGVQALGGPGECSVIGRRERLAVRDAALVNGVLIHGLDFDDTHLGSIVHPTAACLPCALSLGEQRQASGRDVLTAYIAGMETAIRIGLAVAGGFHHAGFHATGIVAHFSSAIVAGRLLGLDAGQMTAAQGIAASTASGVQVFLEEGAWTKRLHPGWAAVAGMTAAHLARTGFKGPSRPYEGRFGLFETHLQAHAEQANVAALAAGLGSAWRLAETAIKPYPVCHFIHGCADAAVSLHEEIDPREIESVEILLPRDTLPIVAEPVKAKLRPANEYEAKFSAPFVVATCLLRGAFGLADLRAEALQDATVLALAARSRCLPDPDSAFPETFSGGVRLAMRDGRQVFRHVRVNSGAGERQLDEAGVSAKFASAAAMTVSARQAARIRDAVLNMETIDAAEFAAVLRLTD